MQNERSRYIRAYRRLLIDAQIPDWEPTFLSSYSPEAAVQAAVESGANALMVYTQSHTGLCHYATRVGRTHAAFRERDLLGDTIALAQQHDLAICLYYSVSFNNWAAETHPDWKLVPATAPVVGGGLLQTPRYALCCPNHPAYRELVRQQTIELVEKYPLDAFFFDTVWWMSICLCESCRALYRAETKAEIPTTIDWLDPAWCRFQRSRERWVTELACELRDLVQKARPAVAVYHNFALGLGNWTRGVGFDSTAGNDFLGGDFYGDRSEQLVVSRLMLNLSRSHPVEFMTTVTANLAEHERLKPPERLELQAAAAATCGAAFLAIAAFDPDGRLNAAQVALARSALREIARFEPFFGGEPIEDIAVYFSSDSKMSFTENGSPLAAAPVQTPFEYPHLRAARGACRSLQERQLPFGVITRKQLANLNRYRVLVLPNVLRMDDEEVAAVRTWVGNGGQLYASRFTSLTATAGRRHEDFMLADVFGCHFERIENGGMVYLDPIDAKCAEAIAPQRMIGHWLDERQFTGLVRLAPMTEGQPLLGLTVAYGHPSRGGATDRDWSSIHSFPPSEKSGRAAVVEHCFGRGRAIYAAADIESGESEAHGALFCHLVGRLARNEWSFDADAHPSVWIGAFDQPERSRWIVSALSYQERLPSIPLPEVRIRLRPTPGRRFTAAVRLPQQVPIATRALPEGAIEITLAPLERFAMLAASYARCE